MEKRLKSLFEDADYDAILIMNTSSQDSNFRYLTDFKSGIFEESIIILYDDHAELFTSELEKEAAIEQADPLIDVHSFGSSKEIFMRMFKSLNSLTLGINESFLPVKYKKFISKYAKAKRIIDAGERLADARRIKDSFEIERIRKAVKITKSALVRVDGYLEDDVTEIELAARFDFLQKEMGAISSFDSIVAFGKNSALPHYAPGKAKLKPNTLVLFDVGGRIDNYCSDISRTFIYRADKSSRDYAKMIDMIDVVKEAQGLALTEMYDGNDSSKPHYAAKDYIDSYKGGIYKGRFIHALGHSIGIDVHDGDVMPSKIRLKKGMVFSDEPGIYINGFGGVRTEDDVLIGSGSSRFI